MKSVRIIRLILLVALAAYLWLFHTANRQQVELPVFQSFLPPLPVAYVVGFALVFGWLVGFLPARIAAWQRSREVTRLRARVAELESQARPPLSERATAVRAGPPATYPATEPDVPVIPDRGNPFHEVPVSDDEAG
ncbi:MAG: LapA family protein [Trueperaceae bacterium]|nr:LapA family protein [Trueperaceae bacterium]MCC6311235.1 LapA family protein [Trueperaceae bacterium]MCO5174864.1 LapA family protein [Trueperaceae bacterium]MCW5818584.1 LapA family protein [Trueperaceae bacterium]